MEEKFGALLLFALGGGLDAALGGSLRTACACASELGVRSAGFSGAGRAIAIGRCRGLIDVDSFATDGAGDNFAACVDGFAGADDFAQGGTFLDDRYFAVQFDEDFAILKCGGGAVLTQALRFVGGDALDDKFFAAEFDRFAVGIGLDDFAQDDSTFGDDAFADLELLAIERDLDDP